MWRAALILWLTLAVGAQAQCRQALSMGLDVSGSVDAREYRLQLEGLAAALRHPDVERALLRAPEPPVRLHVFAWAGPNSRRLLRDWTEIRTASDLQSIATTLRRAARRPADPATAMGEAMEFGAAALAAQTDCHRLTLDISGDGRSNAGPRPRDVKTAIERAGITVNGLVVGSAGPSQTASLAAYYRAEVIHGPESFVEIAAGFADFEQAMVRKLLRELRTMMLSRSD